MMMRVKNHEPGEERDEISSPGILKRSTEHLARGRLGVCLGASQENLDPRSLEVRHIDLCQPQPVLVANVWERCAALCENQPCESAQKFGLIVVILGGADGYPDVGEWVIPIHGNVGHHPCDPKPLSVSFNHLADGGPVAEELTSRPGVDHGDEIGVALVFLGIGTSLQKIKMHDLPEGSIRLFHV